ncbi:MAG: hypothetical protein AAB445_02155 [Patescibacteria group bacterium]
MKRFILLIASGMERLREGEHSLKCIWIFFCTAICAAVGGLYSYPAFWATLFYNWLFGIPSPETLQATFVGWGMLSVGGFVLFGMLVAYKHIWAVSSPNAQPVHNSEMSAPRPLSVEDKVRLQLTTVA